MTLGFPYLVGVLNHGQKLVCFRELEQLKLHCLIKTLIIGVQKRKHTKKSWTLVLEILLCCNESLIYIYHCLLYRESIVQFLFIFHYHLAAFIYDTNAIINNCGKIIQNAQVPQKSIMTQIVNKNIPKIYSQYFYLFKNDFFHQGPIHEVSTMYQVIVFYMHC